MTADGIGIFCGIIISLGGLGLILIINQWYGLIIGSIPTIIGTLIVCQNIDKVSGEKDEK